MYIVTHSALLAALVLVFELMIIGYNVRYRLSDSYSVLLKMKNSALIAEHSPTLTMRFRFEHLFDNESGTVYYE